MGKAVVQLATEKAIRFEMETLPVRLLDEEKLDRAQKLAQAEQDLRVQQLKAEGVKKKLKAEEAEIQDRLVFYAEVVRKGEEPRSVKVGIFRHPARDGWVQEVRDDTGEVVRERRGMDNELQHPLL